MSNQHIHKRASGEKPSMMKIVARSFRVQDTLDSAQAEGILTSIQTKSMQKSVKHIRWGSFWKSMSMGFVLPMNGSISERLREIKAAADSIMNTKFKREEESEKRLSEMNSLYNPAELEATDDLTVFIWKKNRETVKTAQEQRRAMAARLKTWVSMVNAYLDPS